MAQPADFNYRMGIKGSLGHRQSGRGVCGNFRFKFMAITNCDDYASIVPNNGPVLFAASTNTGANTDVFGTGPMIVTGTATSDTANELVDSAATFSSMWSGLAVQETTNNDWAKTVSCKDADELYCFDKSGTATDPFSAGNEGWQCNNDRHIELTSASTTYEGYLIVFGR